jgi:hypothetical protein
MGCVRRMLVKARLLSVCAFLSIVGPASAIQLSVDLTPVANADWRIWGPEYPLGTTTLGGVEFAIPSIGPNTWSSEYAGAGYHQLTVDIGVFGVSKAYTLINTTWGKVGGPYLSLEFYGDGGAYYKKDLYGDVDVRDYMQSTWTNTINGTTTTEVFSGLRLHDGIWKAYRADMQTIALPDAFSSQTLLRMVLTDSGDIGFQRGQLSGMTVEAVPEPATVLAVALGLGAALARRRRR